ncbi:MAG: 3-phosphoshikimate 1-carboxyvinyltransferase [bacterium]
MARPGIVGRLVPPGDKSLSHRALILAAIAGGETELTGLNPGADVESTADALRHLGTRIETDGEVWRVTGPGAAGFSRPRVALDCGNSGTTLRLLAGVLAGCPFETTLRGDESLSRRPMARVVEPLRALGASVAGRDEGGRLVAPLRIRGGSLRPGRHESAVASAQVKSAVLLAGLVGGVAVEVTEPMRSRDHTERMLRALGARIEIEGLTVRCGGGSIAAPRGRVPGDPSAAAFFAAAAAALPRSDLVIEGVSLNPGRLGFYRAIARMGARVEWTREARWCGEPVGRIRVRSGKLAGIRVTARAVPAMIDEIPVLAVLAAGAAKGETRIRGASELRVKESDRLAGLAAGLGNLGGRVEELSDGLVIRGGALHGGGVDALGDHRLAMAFRIAGLLASGAVRVRGADAMRISHPAFDRDLRRLLTGARAGRKSA